MLRRPARVLQGDRVGRVVDLLRLVLVVAVVRESRLLDQAHKAAARGLIDPDFYLRPHRL